MYLNKFTAIIGVMLIILLAGCVTPTPYDYSAYKLSKPKSIVILTPMNNSPDVKAPYSMLSVMSKPLAEAGYYVFPVAVVEETFKQNGLTNAIEIQALPPAKLHDIFGADAALYINIKEYGATYKILSSDTVVTAEAKLVDLKTGALLWNGSATASSAEQNNSNNNGLAGLLVKAVIDQIASNLTDQGHKIADITSNRLLQAGTVNSILYGPRSTLYGQDPVLTK